MACKIGFLVEYLVALWAGEAILGQNGFRRFMENPVVISQVPLVCKLLIAYLAGLLVNVRATFQVTV